MKLGTKLGLALATAGTTAFLISQNRILRATPWTVKHPALPDAFSGLRVLMISDLHATMFGHDQKALLRLVDNADADLCVITGDLIDRRRTITDDDMRPALSLLKGLACRLPTVRVDGNHEVASVVGARFRELADTTGVHNITGRGITVRRGNGAIAIIGVPDIAAVYYDEPRWRDTLEAVYAPYADTFTVALSHRPQYFDDYVAAGLPLTLCGHAHGGQVRLPLIGGLYAPEQGILPKYTAGKHRQGDSQMVVSRGLGNSGFPLRFNNYPEVCLLTLLKAEPDYGD